MYVQLCVCLYFSGFSVDWWALGVLMFEMMAGRSPFDIVGSSDNPDQNTEDYLFQGTWQMHECFKKCFMFLSISHVFFCSSFAVILEKQIRIPRSLSVKAASVLKGFLNKVKQTRRININVFVTLTCYSAVIIIVSLLYFLTSVLPFSFTLHLSTSFICFCLSVHCFSLWIFFPLFW